MRVRAVLPRRVCRDGRGVSPVSPAHKGVWESRWGSCPSMRRFSTGLPPTPIQAVLAPYGIPFWSCDALAAHPSGLTDDRRESVRRSAEEIVPLVMKLVPAKSVVDVGCGLGTWLAVFREQGATETLGIDGEWIDRNHLEIPSESFMAFDLTQPLRLDRRFDLV